MVHASFFYIHELEQLFLLFYLYYMLIIRIFHVKCLKKMVDFTYNIIFFIAYKTT